MRHLVTGLACSAALLLAAAGARADEAELQRRVDQLEQRIRDLEDQLAGTAASEPRSDRLGGDGAKRPGWQERVRVSGNADVGYWNGEENGPDDSGHWTVRNTRLFFDVDLGWNAELGDRKLVDATSAYFEWDLIRAGEVLSDVGSMYVRLDGLLGVRALNMKLGRMPLAYGEEYFRFHEDRHRSPFLSFSAAAPYGWDEGVQLFGSLGESFDYALSVTNGEYQLDDNPGSEPQLTAKFSVRPMPWAKLSLSGTRLGETGTSSLSFGGSFGYPIGFFPPDVIPPGFMAPPTFQDGIPVGPDPDPLLEDMFAWETDLVLTPDLGRLWLGYGRIGLRSDTASAYDRDLTYWLAEGVVELGELSPALQRFYMAGRYSTFGTSDSGEGYAIDAFVDGNFLGYNAHQVDLATAAVGFRLTDQVLFKAEYSWLDFELVDGVPPFLTDFAEDRDFFAVGVSLGF